MLRFLVTPTVPLLPAYLSGPPERLSILQISYREILLMLTRAKFTLNEIDSAQEMKSKNKNTCQCQLECRKEIEQVKHYVAIADFLLNARHRLLEDEPADTIKRDFSHHRNRTVVELAKRQNRINLLHGIYNCTLKTAKEKITNVTKYFGDFDQLIKREEEKLRLVKHYFKDIEMYIDKDGLINGRYENTLSKEGVIATTNHAWDSIDWALNNFGDLSKVKEELGKIQLHIGCCKLGAQLESLQLPRVETGRKILQK